MTDLLSATFGPTIVLDKLLSPVDGIAEAHIYGSRAARYHNIPGGIPRDVDVLVVGDIDDDELYEIARIAERTLGREVNIRRVTLNTWMAATNDSFLTSVQSQPMVRLALGQKR